MAPPEIPGVDPVVRRAARPVQLIDGAERFPDLYGQDGPVWIGPEEADAPAAPARPAEPFPDPLADFEAELTSARAESGILDEEPELDEIRDELAVLPDERNGEFAPEDEDALEVYDPSVDADFALDAEPDDAVDHDLDEDLGDVQRPAGSVGPQALTPMGRYRAEVTESPEFEWRIPPRRVLTRSGKESPAPAASTSSRPPRCSSRPWDTSA